MRHACVGSGAGVVGTAAGELALSFCLAMWCCSQRRLCCRAFGPPAGKVTAAEYLSAQLGGAPAATQEAVKAFRM